METKQEPVVLKLGNYEDVPSEFTGIVHRSRGSKEWVLNGKLHRLDGPAIEWVDGGKEWWLNGERHRVDGPAIEWANGDKEWWLNGKHYFEDDWKKEVAKLTNKPAEEAKAVEEKVLKLGNYEDVPSEFTGIVHRSSGSKSWWLNGKLHREDGPAVEWVDGGKQWWLNDMLYSEDDWKKEVAKLTNKPVEEANPMKKLDSRFGDFIQANDGGLNTRLLLVPSAEVFRKEFRTNKSSAGEGWYETDDGEFIHYKNGVVSPCPRMKVSYIHYVEKNDKFIIVTETTGEDEEYFVCDGTPSNFYVELDNKTGQLSYSMGWIHPDGGNGWRLLADTSKGNIDVYNSVTGLTTWMSKGVWEGASETVPMVYPIQPATVAVSPAVEPSTNSGMIKRAATTIRGDLPVVGLRVASGQVTKAIQSIIVQLLSKSATSAASKKSFINQLNTFFSTSSGKVVLGFMSSLLLPQLNRMIPEKYHSVLSALSDEMRIQAETTVACSVVDELTETLHFISQSMIQSIDALSGVNAETMVNSGPRVLVETINDQPSVESADETVVFQSTGTETSKA